MSFISPSTVYSEVQKAIDYVIKHNKYSSSPHDLAKSITKKSLNVGHHEHNLFDYDCISEDDIKHVSDNFTSTFGYTPDELLSTKTDAKTIARKVVNFNAFYIFLPIALIALFSIWFMVIAKWFNWFIGIYLTIFFVTLIYIFNIAYRMHTIGSINVTKTTETTTHLEHFIAHLPLVLQMTNQIMSSK